ncbi:MAG: methyltransferase domain-containing protein [Ignavibacteriaceae bacterium]|jgi:ubiquinone/menaquinone biosynthesis C-methylase UbiE|nr:methyltransferase domain-containing protein [Ignavibacteriaceae bacterium]
MHKTDYSKIAGTYDNRYKENYLSSIDKLLKQVIFDNGYKIILEAGCGTGKWIKSFDDLGLKVFGLDYSLDMLKMFDRGDSKAQMINTDACSIPVKDNSIDLIFCVNAIHHFPDKKKFISECKRTLKQNGMITAFGVDPYCDKEWYVYDYFENVYQNDLKRFLSVDSMKTLLDSEGFKEINIGIAEKVFNERIGDEVFEDPFLGKNHSSQLADISDQKYEQGIEKIKTQIKNNPNTIFKTSVVFYLISAKQ